MIIIKYIHIKHVIKIYSMVTRLAEVYEKIIDEIYSNYNKPSVNSELIATTKY